jgi:plasmid maintenance system killer protein
MLGRPQCQKHEFLFPSTQFVRPIAAPRWLEAAVELRDLGALPGNRLEALKGDRKGQYSIRINEQWRICLEWPGRATGPSNVEIVDYH